MADVVITTRLDGVNDMIKGLDRVSSSLNNIGNKLSLAITAPLLAVGTAAVKMAMDAQESENLFQVAMGDMADAARQFSKDMRSELGLNEFEVRKNVATIFQMTQSMGVAKGAAFDMSIGMTKLTNDMASFFNLGADEAFNKLTAAISGESEPLKRLGIIVNETTIETYALKNGLIAAGDTMSEQQKVLARYGVIVEATKNAQGDLARTLDSPTNQFRLLKGEINQTAVELGMMLMPAVRVFLRLAMDVKDRVQDMVQEFRQLSPEMQTLVLSFISLAALSGPLAKGMAGLLSVVSVLARGMLLLLSPFGLLAAAVTAVVVGVSMLLPDLKELGQIFDDIWQFASKAATAVGEFFMSIPGMASALDFIKDKTKSLTGAVTDFFEQTAPEHSLFDDAKEKAGSAFDSISAKMQSVFANMGLISGTTMQGVSNDAVATGEAISNSALQFGESFRTAFAEGREEVRKTRKEIEEDQKKARDAALQTAQYQIRIQKATTSDLLDLLHRQLVEVKGNAGEEIRIRTQIADAIEDNTREHLDYLQRENRTIQQQQEYLRQLRTDYAQMGDEAGGALRIIDLELKKIDDQIKNRTFSAGAAKGIRDYFDDISNRGKSAADFVGSSFKSLEGSLSTFFQTGKFEFGDFVDSIKKGLADLAARETINLFGSLLGLGGAGGGGGGGGGFMGGLFGNLFEGIGGAIGDAAGGIGGFVRDIFGFNQGGMVPGDGPGHVDSVLAGLAPGEFVVNARATRNNRHLLERLNASGRGFADGGGLPDMSVMGDFGGIPGVDFGTGQAPGGGFGISSLPGMTNETQGRGGFLGFLGSLFGFGGGSRGGMNGGFNYGGSFFQGPTGIARGDAVVQAAYDMFPGLFDSREGRSQVQDAITEFGSGFGGSGLFGAIISIIGSLLGGPIGMFGGLVANGIRGLDAASRGNPTAGGGIVGGAINFALNQGWLGPDSPLSMGGGRSGGGGGGAGGGSGSDSGVTAYFEDMFRNLGAVAGLTSASILGNASSGPLSNMEAAFATLRGAGDSIITQSFATGGDSLFSSPSLISVAENGPEMVSVRSSGSRASRGGGVNIIMNGPAIFDETSRARFVRSLSRSLAKEQMRGG